ncbi:MAG: hypothetical protein HY308_15665 [Gammaproteobacteria bacterium]|nr:hypothetical protein [Gammaproteobacteria bacterium]
MSIELGIGIVGNDVVPSNGKINVDVNGDGSPDQFTQCSTTEGVSFNLWAKSAYEGKPLWSGYYYIGYDTEANCP